MSTGPVLRIENLQVALPAGGDRTHAVNGVSLSIEPGKTLCVVGESGSGKSVTALSVLRLLPPGGRLLRGSMRLGSTDLVKISERELGAIRGRRIGMIFQDPQTSLNPVMTVGQQIGEVLKLHLNLDRDALRLRVLEWLEQVGLPDPERHFGLYPHQLSGGMRQRAMIAMALVTQPQLLIADEPTTALDVTMQAQIMELIRDLQREMGMSVLLITHDLGVIAENCDDVIVMYLGEVMERADVKHLFADPLHPYTRALLRSIPRLGRAKSWELEPIEGMVPSPYNRATGCPFHPRCEAFMAGVCDTTRPVLTRFDDGRAVRCHLYPQTDAVQPSSDASPAEKK